MKWLKNLLARNNDRSSLAQFISASNTPIETLVDKQCWGLARNEYFKLAERARKAGNRDEALRYYSLVIFLDRNGATNIEMSDSDLRKLGTSRWDRENGSFNETVLAQLQKCLDTNAYTYFEKIFLIECENEVVRQSSEKPPFNPRKVLAELKRHADESKK